MAVGHLILGVMASQNQGRPVVEPVEPEPVTFGYITDVENADKNTLGTRHFRDAPDKLTAAVAAFNAAALDFVIHGGDYLHHDHDGATEAEALTDLAAIEAVYADVTADRFYVFGNHCLDQVSKAQFIANSGMTENYYALNIKGQRFIVLDDCFRSDDDDDPYDSGNFNHTDSFIPPAQRAWLTSQLSSAPGDVYVFLHRQMHGDEANHLSNASTVRGILEAAGNVKAVFSAHAHLNRKDTVNGIDYYTLNAAVEDAHPSTAWSIITVDDGSVVIEGASNQASWSTKPIEAIALPAHLPRPVNGALEAHFDAAGVESLSLHLSGLRVEDDWTRVMISLLTGSPPTPAADHRWATEGFTTSLFAGANDASGETKINLTYQPVAQDGEVGDQPEKALGGVIEISRPVDGSLDRLVQARMVHSNPNISENSWLNEVTGRIGPAAITGVRVHSSSLLIEGSLTIHADPEED